MDDSRIIAVCPKYIHSIYFICRSTLGHLYKDISCFLPSSPRPTSFAMKSTILCHPTWFGWILQCCLMSDQDFFSPLGSFLPESGCWQMQLFQPRKRPVSTRHSSQIPLFPPFSYVEVKVDVDETVALPITSLVVELSNVSVALLPKDHEAWGVGHAFSISQVSLCWEIMCTFKERNGFVKRLMMLVKSQ